MDPWRETEEMKIFLGNQNQKEIYTFLGHILSKKSLENLTQDISKPKETRGIRVRVRIRGRSRQTKLI